MLRVFFAAAAMSALSPVIAFAQAAETSELKPVRIADPVNGHIHPSACASRQGMIVVTYGRVNHRDLRITRSTDGGRTWAPPTPFGPTENKTYYPGSLTTLSDGRLLHAWNRWNGETSEDEPRSVLVSLSSDDGLRWSDPLPRDPKVMSVVRHPIVELSPGRWLFSLSDCTLVYYNPGRPIGGRACPRTVELDADTIGVAFYDIDANQPGGPGLFFLRIPRAKLAAP